MTYRIQGTLKLPDGAPAANCEVEFVSRKNFSPLVQGAKTNILTNATGAYDVTLELGEYAVIVYTGGTYPAQVGTILISADTVAGQDLPSLLQHDGWTPATPDYVQQIENWVASASQSAANADASADAAADSAASAAGAAESAISTHKTESDAHAIEKITGLRDELDSLAGAAPIYLDRFGAAGDGVNNDLPAFNAAKSELGVANECRLMAGKTYYFAGSRPDLSGLAIYAERGAKIKTDANPNIKTMTLLNDVTINNTVHATTLVKRGNVNHDYLVSAGASINRLSGQNLTKKLFTDSDVSLSAITNVATKSAFTGVNNTSYLSWAADFASGQQGAFIPFETDVMFEAAFRNIGTATVAASSYRSVSVICGTAKRVDFALYTGNAVAKLIVQTPAITTVDIQLPNGGAYSLSDDGAITLGVRVVNGIAEFYSNGVLLYKYALGATATEIAFLTSWNTASKCQILLPTKSSCVMPNSSKPKKLAIVGDSISYGAWASESYDSILAKSLEHCGIGGVTTVNYAVSGSATSNWIAGGSIDITTKDVSDCDYTLIMLGTNDVQGGVTGTQYESNMRAIVANVVSQGSRPVLGVFPVWTQASVSGVTGVTTQNYAKGGWHRQIIKMLAAELGLPLADVCAKFGSNIQWYGDNIHPLEHGLIAVASAFAEAIISDSCPAPITPRVITEPVKINPTLVNSWVAISGQQVPTVRADMFGQVMLYGPITGGAVGSVITTLATAYRPPFKRSFKIHLNDGATLNGYGRLDINADGTVVLSQSSITTPAVVFLDGAAWAL